MLKTITLLKMIRNDFIDGGFRINKRCPVFCLSDQAEILIAYDQYALKLAIDNKKIIKCIGVWPGKYSTDCFPLNPEKYRYAPPQLHRDIDNARSIEVNYKAGEFENIIYSIEDLQGIILQVETKDKDLLDYITKIGLQFKSIFN
jgi:hypothetical protein